MVHNSIFVNQCFKKFGFQKSQADVQLTDFAEEK